MPEISPMMRQYLGIKEKYKDSILFFRLGDFYEMFFDDAKLVSEELDLTLTGKDYGQKERAPMCGIPYHSCEAYIARLVAKGYKIAMCDQVEEPAKAKGIVKREVVRVVTPGTVMEESMLDESKNNYICSVYIAKKAESACISFCDISTGELKVTDFSGDTSKVINEIKNELGKFFPTEILAYGDISCLNTLKQFVLGRLSCRFEILYEDISEDASKELLKTHFKNIDKNGLWSKVCVLKSLGILFSYLKNTQKTGLERIEKVSYYNSSEYMGLDINAIRNLELMETLRSKSKKGSLLWVLDKTKTAMGKRLLRSWIERPLCDVVKITNRQEGVEELVNNIAMRDELSDLLSGVHDIERIMTKITYGSANARDLKSLSATLSKLPEIKFNLYKSKSKILKYMCDNLDLAKDVYMLIEDAIVEEPPFLVKEGGIIKKGYSPEVDQLRDDVSGGKNTIAEIEKREREKTGIPKLKVGYNRVFGYYIEVTNPYKDKVPENYIRKQTLTNCERYITQELKDLESRILYARDKINDTEYRIFEDVRRKVAARLSEMTKIATIIANLDVVRSLAETAFLNNYTKPVVNNEDTINIAEGRHPVVELLINGAPFVPNSAVLDNKKNTIALITGPNMAGKSTYMRQIALIVLMAQIGSFVPAQSAEIGIVDNIFTRIGASDDLSSGQSTFMLEMNEVADIIKNATPKSLLILDEIGRGTSTFDGMSIAKAVLEYIADAKKIGAKTLFATHYHELTSMSDEFDNIKNYNVSVKRRGEDITFLRRIVPGAADDSYGIEVAKLAGLPKGIIERSREILKTLESGEAQFASCGAHTKDSQNVQLKFESVNSKNNELIERLKNLDISVLTPIEAMNVLYKLVSDANEAF